MTINSFAVPRRVTTLSIPVADVPEDMLQKEEHLTREREETYQAIRAERSKPIAEQDF